MITSLGIPNSTIVGTVAALCGSAIGGLVPLLSNVVFQRGLTKRDVFNRQVEALESLYSEFILESSRLLSHSLFNSLQEPDKIVTVYTLVARIRLNSSAAVIVAAERIVKRVITQYGQPNVSIEEMRAALLTSQVDQMGDFTAACRTELFEVFKRGGALQRQT